MSDALHDDRTSRTFDVSDDYKREALRIELDVSLPAKRLIRVLDQLVLVRGHSERIRVYHGPESTSPRSVPGARPTVWRSSTSSPPSRAQAAP